MHASTTVKWNVLARTLVAEGRVTPPWASRVYALLSVAQFEAATAARESATQRSAINTASAAVLAFLFPDQTARVQEFARQSAAAIEEGNAAGHEAAQRIIRWAEADGAGAVWNGRPPTGPGIWRSNEVPEVPPQAPLWGRVRPWLMRSGNQFRPAPPPQFGTPAFQDALREVKQITEARSEAEVRIAREWADAIGTPTPSGHWNQIATELILRYRLDEQSGAEVLALMNMAVMDAGIACWEAKYTFWLIRPSQADPTIVTAVALPNFPSYTSGHASFSGAASEVLAAFFPSDSGRLRALAEEAAFSRVLAGLHYRFDSESGLWQGRAVARLALDRREVLMGRLP